jgi:hypothetical protein
VRTRAALFVALFALAACDRMATNLAGGIKPEMGVLRGKLPIASPGVMHAQRLTDGIASEVGDPERTDLTAPFSSTEASATWDLGSEVPIRCAMIEADNAGTYDFALSSDGQTFTPLWTAGADEEGGLQLRGKRDLVGKGRYLRVSPARGEGKFYVAEVSAWSECPKEFPPLAIIHGVPPEAGLSLKIWALALLAFAWVLFYTPKRPDWYKLLGVAPAGLAISVAKQAYDAWPLPGKLVLLLAGGVAWIGIAVAIKLGRMRRAPAPAKPVDE